ncbi:MAG: M28 family peptidase [Planctomycetes bacterium]|nr:M28 family peptidase [Planctomycetota bacterium]
MSRFSRHFLLGLPLLAAAIFAIVQAVPAAETLDPSVERMKKDIFFLASDQCEGRGVETEGINKAADHIAGIFKELGLKPAMADGSYFQPFPIAGSAKLGATNKLTLKGPLGQEIMPVINKQFAVSGLTGKGLASKEVVFAGYGISIPHGYDDFAGIDVKEKIVIMMRQTPRVKNKFMPFPDPQTYAPLIAKIQAAESRKAAGILFVNDRDMAGPDDLLMDFSYARGSSAASVPVFQVRRALVDQMMAPYDKRLEDIEADIDFDLKPRSFAMPGWTATLEASVTRTEFLVKNVIGVLEGKGPLANETIVIGAHYDHLGKGEIGSRSKGSKAIHYGADDNGSGTTSILELARRFTAMKDREGRRIVFMTFSGEERGLLGSAYYCRNPLFPLKDTVAMINLDMVGRLREDPSFWTRAFNYPRKGNLEVGGLGSAKNFEGLIDDMNKVYNFKIKKTRSGTGPSDHTSFYLKGIPVFFFFTGLHAEYHMPADKPETINLEGMKKVVDMVQEVAVSISSGKEKPVYVASSNKGPSTSAGGVPTIRFMPGDYDDDQDKGVLVGGVFKEGPADKAGIKEGDWIVEIAGQPVRNMAGYMKVMGGQKGGQPIDFVVKRGEKKVPLRVTPIPPTTVKN